MDERSLNDLFREACALRGDPESGRDWLIALTERYLNEFGRAAPGAAESVLRRWIREEGAPAVLDGSGPVLDEETSARLLGRLSGAGRGLRLAEELELHVTAPRLGRNGPWYLRIGTPLLRGGVAAAITILAVFWSTRRADPELAVDAVMAELARHHRSAPRPELKARSWTEVEGAARALDPESAPPAPSEVMRMVQSARWSYRGVGRTQIAQRPAWFIVLEDRELGSEQVLYQLRRPKSLQLQALEGAPEGQGLEAEIDGDIVRLWLEKDLVLGLVGPK
ncbi:MAG: hypothetical protein IT285_03260 [Bdellovibrionales bacterium]|nr:hypothetical protein [Bdellovibrionales bacterium]